MARHLSNPGTSESKDGASATGAGTRMKRLRLDRLRRMSAHEWRWRALDALHTAAERVRTRTGAARWKRKDISGILATAALDVCREDIERENWEGVHEALATHIAARPARFVLDPSSSAAVRDR